MDENIILEEIIPQVIASTIFDGMSNYVEPVSGAKKIQKLEKLNKRYKIAVIILSVLLIIAFILMVLLILITPFSYAKCT